VHYLESITTFFRSQTFIKHRSSAVNGAMFIKSHAICDVRDMVPLCIEYLTAVKKLTSMIFVIMRFLVVFLFLFYWKKIRKL